MLALLPVSMQIRFTVVKSQGGDREVSITDSSDSHCLPVYSPLRCHGFPIMLHTGTWRPSLTVKRYLRSSHSF